MGSAKAVTALLVMPCWARRVVSVAPSIANTKPEEMPRNSAAMGADSKYGCSPAGRLPRHPLSERVVIVDNERRVIGETARLVDEFPVGGLRNARRRHLIVDAPTDVLLVCLAPVRPPGVLVGLGIQTAEDIDIAELVEHLREPGALLGQEARVLLVGFPVPEVDLIVRDVPVAAQDELVPALLQLLQMHDELLQEPELRRLAMRPGRTRGQINGDDPELAEARLDISALRVEFLARKTARDFVGRLAAHQSDAAIAFLLCEGVARGKALEPVQPGIEIELLAFHFLQADDV